MKSHEKVKNIIASKCNISVDEITNDMSLSHITKDGFEMMDLFFDIEQLMGKKFPVDDLRDIQTIGDVLYYYNKLVQ